MHIMHSMVRNRIGKEEVRQMEEKVYKTMGHSGALSIVVGVVSIVAGIAGGVLLIISGARLLANKSKILF